VFCPEATSCHQALLPKGSDLSPFFYIFPVLCVFTVGEQRGVKGEDLFEASLWVIAVGLNTNMEIKWEISSAKSPKKYFLCQLGK